MSPHNFNGVGAHMFYVYSNGFLSNYGVDHTYGVRPVINLKPTVTLSGSGTTSTPYTVS